MVVDFWAKKREQLQQEGKLLPPRQEPISGSPWWDETGSITQAKQYTTGTRVTPDQHSEEIEHDYSRAMHLKSKEGNCPNCYSGNYMKPSASASTRCFDCGYIAGRVVNDLDNFAISPNARRLEVRQPSSAHGIRTSRKAEEIIRMNSTLEASALGKAQID